MRITGGIARGIPLRTPKGAVTRPATDALRQAIFSSIGDRVIDSSVLDLFAGSGAYGLEAASRGAQHVQFVELSGPSLAALRTNRHAVLKALQQQDRSPTLEVQGANVFSWCKRLRSQWDIVIADPPYPLLEKHFDEILSCCMEALKRTANSRLILEVPSELAFNPPPELHLIRTLGKGSARQPNAWIMGWLEPDD